MHRLFQHALDCEVFPKSADWQFSGWQLPSPVVVVCEWVAVNGLIFSAVNTEIRLTVAIQIELSQSDAAVDRFLEDSSNHASPAPGHFAGKPNIHRDYLHMTLVLSCRVRSELIHSRV